MKVACFSVSGEQLTLNNVATPNGWRFFEHLDWQGIAMYEPDVVYVGGWFAANYGDWQVFKGMIGQAKKVIVQWFGSDVLTAKGFYDQGQRTMYEWLNSDRVVNIPPSEKIKQEIEEWLEVQTTDVLNVPAEEVFSPEDFEKYVMPEKPQVAVYMPPGRQDFFRLALIKEVIALVPEANFLFYHWLPEIEPIQVRTGPNPEDVWQPDDKWKKFGTTRDEYKQIIGESICALRIPVHDANSITGAEFLMSGKPFVSDRDMPNYKRLVRGDTTPESVARAIKRVLRRPHVDAVVSDFCRDRWDPVKYRQRLEERCRTKWEGFSFGQPE